MKKIIDGVLYNTETAQNLAEYWNGCTHSDFNYMAETIYRTKKGNFFLHGEGGAASKYAKAAGRGSNPGKEIIALSEDEVFEILQEWNEVELIEEMFPDKITEG